MQKIPTIWTHLIGWFFFALLPMLFLSGRNNFTIPGFLGSFSFWYFMAIYACIFYGLYLLLVPALFLSRQYFLFISAVAGLLLLVYYLHPFDQLIGIFDRPGPLSPMPGDRPQSGRRIRFDIVSVILFLMITALAIALQLTRKWQLEAERAARAETEKANAELAFLKAQIHPHFLFNTLNNIYSMAVTDNPNTADSILKLSNIMRYVTDEINAAFVPLSEEIKCISDFIDLQKLRTGEMVTVDFEVSGDFHHHKVAPLIFMSFIENVFKYGISKHEPCALAVKIDANPGGINFYCRNAVFLTTSLRKTTGIGIANTKQRLELIYPGKHSLHIENKKGFFSVELVLIN